MTLRVVQPVEVEGSIGPKGKRGQFGPGTITDTSEMGGDWTALEGFLFNDEIGFMAAACIVFVACSSDQ